MEKYILITGGTKGIGRAVADILAQSGYKLILTYGSDEVQAAKVKAEFQELYPASVEVLQADISEKQAIDTIENYLNTHDIYLFSVVFNAEKKIVGLSLQNSLISAVLPTRRLP